MKSAYRALFRLLGSRDSAVDAYVFDCRRDLSLRGKSRSGAFANMNAIDHRKAYRPDSWGKNTKSTKGDISFRGLIDNVIRKAMRQITLDDAVQVLTTLDGKIAIDDAQNGLSDRDRLLVEKYGKNRIYASGSIEKNLCRKAATLAITQTAKVAILLAGEEGQGFRPVANVDICPDEPLTVAETDNRGDDTADDILSGMSGAKMLQVLDVVEFHVDHIDPVVLHVGSMTFTNFDNLNNLLARPAIKRPGFLLTDLRARPVEAWSKDERTLVASVYLLSLARVRVEEFNGQQLSLSSVSEHLVAKYQDLCALVGAKPEDVGLLDLPRKICELRDQIRPFMFVCRHVNGLTFCKHEHFLRRSEVDLSIGAIPELLASEIASVFDCRSDGHISIDSYFSEVVSYALRMEVGPSSAFTPLEHLLELVVRSAMEGASASIGMTRGVRDLRRWASLFAGGSYTELCDLPSTEYYCAVFADRQTEEGLREDGQFQKVLAAIAQRMTFNSWHYTPGHVPVEAVPKDRHFYIPPRMSDIAVWSDRHHQGHILAKVRHSIRSPGGLLVNGKKQYGLFDVRLMRNDGEAFNMIDLICARRHTAYLRAVFQAILDMSSGKEERTIIRSFAKKDYASA